MTYERVQPGLPEAMGGGPLFGAARLVRPPWRHQRRALAAFERDRAQGDAATYLVVPPGGGKTLIGLEAARRLGRPTVVLCPNTAIQSQWINQWRTAFAPITVTPTVSRDLPTALTVLTYQAVCTLGAGGNGEPGEAAESAADPGGCGWTASPYRRAGPTVRRCCRCCIRTAGR
jgi:hypothetical protein